MTTEQFEGNNAYKRKLIEMSMGGSSAGKTHTARIALTVMNIAEGASLHLKRMPRPMKTMRICKAHRRRIALWRAMLAAIPLMGVRQIADVMAQPIPKYPSGGSVASVGDNCPEYFERITPTKPEISFLPDGYKVWPIFNKP